MAVAPVMPGTAPETLKVVVMSALHAATLYEIVTVPGAMPDTVPVIAFILAVAGALLLHVPPADTECNVAGRPMQTDDPPVIGPDALPTDTTAALPHPVGSM